MVIFTGHAQARIMRYGIYFRSYNTGALRGLAFLLKGVVTMAAFYIRSDGEICFSLFANDPKKPRKSRGTCGARTRKNTPCQAPPVWDKENDKARNGRCKLHGGWSTGARTEKGREAIRESNRRRAKQGQPLSGK